MKKILLLFILSSFLVGFTVGDGDYFSIYFIADFFRTPGNYLQTWSDFLKVFTLIVCQLGIISLFFLKESRLFKAYFIFISIVFILSYCWNTMLYILMQNSILYSFIPFFILWLVCLIYIPERAKIKVHN